jgi:hypothetical protein
VVREEGEGEEGWVMGGRSLGADGIVLLGLYVSVRRMGDLRDLISDESSSHGYSTFVKIATPSPMGVVRASPAASLKASPNRAGLSD